MYGMGVEDEVIVVEMFDGWRFFRGYFLFLYFCFLGINRIFSYDIIMLNGDEEVDRLVL